MDVQKYDSRREQSEERYQEDSPVRGHRDGGNYDSEDIGTGKTRESSRHKSKDSKKRSRREEKDYRISDKEREKTSEVLKESRDLEKDRTYSKEKRKEDKHSYEKGGSRSKDKDRNYDKEKSRDNLDHEKEKVRERDKDRQDRARGSDRDRERLSGKDSDRVRERGRDKTKENDREANHEKEISTEDDRGHRKSHDFKNHDKSKDSKMRSVNDDQRDDAVLPKVAKDFHEHGGEKSTKDGLHSESTPSNQTTSILEERILKMREERLSSKHEGASDVLSWVNKSRKLEEKRNAEKEKALKRSILFEEQDIIDDEGDNEESTLHTSRDLAGLKVLHGLDKVMEGGAVVLTLKDQSILANGGLNEDVDMLENVEIGEQKQREEAYKAAKKKPGIYEDKFNDEPGAVKKMLPQYDDSVKYEGVTLDELGRFPSEAEKKLEELRRRLQGGSSNNHVEDLSFSTKISSDYYTQEEMLKFKKPKKKKSLRKKEKLDIDALEAEAVSAGLGTGDLGSRNDGTIQAVRKEKEKSDAETRQNAYQSALAKAEEASQALRVEQSVTTKQEEEEFFADDDDLRQSLERARKLALRKKNEDVKVGPQAVALLAASTPNNQTGEIQNSTSDETNENKVVFTEMEEFVWGLQLDEESHKPDSEDVFMEEDDSPKASDQDAKVEAGGWTEVKDEEREEGSIKEDNEVIPLDETIHEVPVGRGLSGALKLLKERGTFKETVEWGGRNMDKKKSKLVGLHENNGTKEINIERTDEFGRIMTPKEAFRRISHKFHGKGPGKMKQEKRMKQYQEEMKLKQMKNSDTPSLSVEKMRETQARLQTPYLVLSGNIKPGQTSDPQSGFATVENNLPGSLTPMLGDKKVEHFLGIKRTAGEGRSMPPPPPPKKPKS